MARGIMIAVYGAREAAITEALAGRADLFIYDRQNNHFNKSRAKIHVADPDGKLDVQRMVEFAREYEDKLDFVLITSEEPIMAGARNQIETATRIPVLCSTEEYAIERSKIFQRRLLDQIAPEANPRYKVFDHSQSLDEIKTEFYQWARELNGNYVIKPDRPGLGKGVVVSGDHFSDDDEAWELFHSAYGTGNDIIVEEKIDGEEFSVQFFSDGKTLVPTPAVRDYKRRFDDDKGPNTGGMGGYSVITNELPFMWRDDYRTAVEIGKRVFGRLRSRKRNPGLWGVPLYFGFTAAKDGVKVIEINTRPGDPEFQHTLAAMDTDFLDLCDSILEGKLDTIQFKKIVSVGAYIVPDIYPGKDDKERKIDLIRAYELLNGMNGRLRIYPASIERRDGDDYALSSRTVYLLGTGERIYDARYNLSRGINSVRDPFFDHRTDIGTPEHIRKSVAHVDALRN